MITIGVMVIGTITVMTIIGVGTVGTAQAGTLVGVVGTAHGTVDIMVGIMADIMAGIMAVTIGTVAITTTITPTTMAEEEVLLTVIMPETEQTIQDMALETHRVITAEETTMPLILETQTSIRLEPIHQAQEITTTVLRDQTPTPHNQEETKEQRRLLPVLITQ